MAKLNSKQSFAHGVASGFSDLVNLPLKGSEEEGALGFAKGVGKGTLGFTSKTTAGKCTIMF